jgi:hypothetical protein
MTTKTEKPLTPALISYTSFISFFNQIREGAVVPARIDKSLMPRASGSQSAGILAALRFFGLIDSIGKPSEEFKAVVLADDEARKPIMASLIKKSYKFLFEDSDFDLTTASSGQMIAKFRDLDFSGSTLTKTIAFFLAAAKDNGIQVSTYVKAPPPPKGNGATRKPVKPKDDGKHVERPRDDEDDASDSNVERFEIPIPGKSSVKVIVPNDLDADDWEMLQSMITVYIKRWKGFKDKEEEK